ncbi:desampylase [Natrialba asiatica]|uniref:Mov34/MPN/PAD-1 family protein n=1 Tax=Natrialba asiatica (strain ATCC 700177 / DSM 12278 / JCM 9576 / FERM P-10747 / NBRC 102637 / 172P1) TaxID=29540 RepID=M0B2W2_NATA1|nr:desampylase [Natrialba asiatica]ELZ04897.1 Mov34/MPN/PAD-1 family protein [Natrialba asiatica DSM 12278]
MTRDPAPDAAADTAGAGPGCDEDGPALVVPEAIRRAIRDRAREGDPEEICGILGGTFGPERSRVRSQYSATNVAETPRTRYRIDPEEQLERFERLEARDEEIVGFYHSHPRGPARPSETDIDAATWTDRSYLIVSLDPFAVRSWRWRAETGGGAPAGTAGDDSEAADGGYFERERLRTE